VLDWCGVDWVIYLVGSFGMACAMLHSFASFFICMFLGDLRLRRDQGGLYTLKYTGREVSRGIVVDKVMSW
jgi:hypothetical protein